MSYRFIASALAVSFAFTAAANAAEVRRKVEIRGEKAAVWAKIGGWCAIADWLPPIAKCEESSAGGKKIRTLTTKDGGVIKETLIKSEPLSYSYTIDESPLPVANYTATLAVLPDDDDEDEVNVVWSAKFDPKGASEADAKKVIEGIFKDGLAEIRKQAKAKK
ncbi:MULTISPECIES: SRPBCC family protein [Rhodomicrobium]|uniref:SRPBCC family protein n=1 Tax=Rhodomicrobium TaxID=1068 RepID=UPI000B4B7C5D|nr:MULTISPECIES: SRPBCC family protein [Rhodomicrobium]